MHLKNSLEFVERIKKVRVHQDNLLVSSDIAKLFSSLPRAEVIKTTAEVLNNDEEVMDAFRTWLLSVADFVWNNTYFKFGKKFFKQVGRITIGGSFSPTAAELFL